MNSNYKMKHHIKHGDKRHQKSLILAMNRFHVKIINTSSIIVQGLPLSKTSEVSVKIEKRIICFSFVYFGVQYRFAFYRFFKDSKEYKFHIANSNKSLPLLVKYGYYPFISGMVNMLRELGVSCSVEI